jgi:hypothetical protein
VEGVVRLLVLPGHFWPGRKPHPLRYATMEAPMPAGVRRRGSSDLARERDTERARRTVADTLRDLAHADAVTAK